LPTTGIFLPDGWTITYVKPSKPLTVYKLVTALPPSHPHPYRIVSVYNGTTTYRLGHVTKADRGAGSWPPQDAALYSYESTTDALKAPFPPKVVVDDGPRFVLSGTAWGRCFYHQGRRIWATEFLRPSRFLLHDALGPLAHDPRSAINQGVRLKREFGELALSTPSLG
jgi:hypothetical protein